MKKIFTKKYLKVFLSIAAISPIVAISSTQTFNSNTSLINNNLKDATSTNTSTFDYDWKTNSNQSTIAYTIPSHMKKTTNSFEYDLDSIQQDTVYDDSYTSYAAIGSSVNNEYKNDLISKFWLSSVAQQKENSGTTSTTMSIPGSKQWVVKKSDLANLINVTNDTETSITSILYSGGGELVSKALFVILNSTNTTTKGSFLFEIKWEDDVKDLKSYSAGDYRLVRQLNSDDTKFNFMTLEAAATHTIHFFELKEYPSSSSSSTRSTTTQPDYTIKAGKITGTQDFKTNTDTQSIYTISVSNSLLSSKIDSNSTYKPIFAFRSNGLGNFVYLIYQAENYTNVNKEKYLFTLKIDTITTSDFTVSSDTSPNAVRIVSLKDSSIGFDEGSDKKLTVTMMQNSNTNYMMFFSQTKTSGTNIGSYGYLNLDMADTSTTDTYSVKKIENKNESALVEVLTVSKLYSATSELIGYLFLTKDFKVYQYSLTFDNPVLLYNFKQSTISFGDIFKIVTTPSSGSWFSQMSDSTFAQFSGSTFVGQWDKLVENQSYELPIAFSVKSQSEISPSVISQKVASGESYASEFINYLANGESYKDFLNVTFQDPRLSISPSINITQSAFANSDDKIYSVTLTFKQKLRKIDYNGNIVSTDSEVKEVTLASQTYKFNNATSKVRAANEIGDDNQEIQPIPAFIKNKLPSQITSDEVKNYLLVLENVTNPTISTTYNDSTGSMRVVVTVPYMWQVGNSGSEELFVNQVFAFDYSEYFAANSLGNSASITEINDQYINKPENSSLKSSLLAKYSAKLPSQVDTKELINSFVIFGPAFSQQQNFDSGVITQVDEWIVNVIPYDKEGKAKIDITIPKVASLKNVKVKFDTPSIFLSNPNANASVYFMFKENADVMNDTLKEQTASSIASKLNSSSSGNNSGVISGLRNFASFSDYFVSYINDGIIKVSATGYDNYGTLKIVLTVTKNGEKLPGFSSSTLENVYSGFKVATGTTLTNDTFKFATNLAVNTENISPLSVTADNLINEYKAFEGSSEQTKNKIVSKNIVLNKSTISGTIQVVVTIENFVESGQVYPQKSFVHTFGGFKQSQEPIDMVVWKSFYEIGEDNQSYKNSRPSDIINSINTTSMSNKEKLNVFANVSTDLSNKIKDSDISIILEGNDGTGELTVTATIKVDDTSLSLSTVVNCNDNQSLTPAINLISDNSTSQELFKLRNKLPSTITPEEASILYSFSNANSYVKDVNLVPDDATGTLTLNVRLLTTAGAEILNSSNTYTQFIKFIPANSGTNWGIIAASIIVPAVILLIPVITLGVIEDRKRRAKIAKKLDTRLNEEYKKSLNKKY